MLVYDDPKANATNPFGRGLAASEAPALLEEKARSSSQPTFDYGTPSHKPPSESALNFIFDATDDKVVKNNPV